MWSLLIVSLTLLSVSGQKCRVLVMAGGGSAGSYEAGALQGLTSLLQSDDIGYDVLTGISIGSINSLSFAQFPKGQEKQASDILMSLWLNLNGSSNVIKNWPGGVIEGLTFRSGLYDTSPLLAFLTANLQVAPTRTVYIGSTSLNSGQFRTFTNLPSLSDWIKVAMTSSAIPGIFPTRSYDGDVFTDGNVVYSMDIFSGIEECLQRVPSQADIIVDMISCTQNKISTDISNLQTLEVYQRGKDISDYYGKLKHIAWAINAYPDVNYRYYLQPSQPLPLTSGLDFSKAGIEGAISIGYNDAVFAVNNNIFLNDVLPVLGNNEGTIYVS